VGSPLRAREIKQSTEVSSLKGNHPFLSDRIAFTISMSLTMSNIEQLKNRQRKLFLAVCFTAATVLLFGGSIWSNLNADGSCISNPPVKKEFLFLGVKSRQGLKGNVRFDLTITGDDKPEMLNVTSGPDGYARLPFDFEQENISLKVRLTYDSLERWSSKELPAALKPGRDTILFCVE
jgi:hypothetical protein